MNRSSFALFLGVCLLSLCAFAQENRIIRVGVPTMENRSAAAFPAMWSGTGWWRALNRQKPDKKLHLKVQGVALDGATPEDVGG